MHAWYHCYLPEKCELCLYEYIYWKPCGMEKKQQEILKEEHRGGTNEGEHHESIRESLERINGK